MVKVHLSLVIILFAGHLTSAININGNVNGVIIPIVKLRSGLVLVQLGQALVLFTVQILNPLELDTVFARLV